MAKVPETLEELLSIGRRMDRDDSTVAVYAGKMLKVRDRTGELQWLTPNLAQAEFERRRGRQNIVLKARQMGMTTWVSGRFFLRTVTHRGMLTLQVAHTQTAAEGIFRAVQRMWEELPQGLREGPLRRSRANVGQMVFPELDSEFRVASAADPGPGRGLSLQNLHCSEVSRWPGNAAETLAGLRAALAPAGELVLESTPNGAYGAFYEAWGAGVEARDQETGLLVRHFLPWWMEPAYVGAAVELETLNEDEQRLVEQHGLTAEQIGFRRGLQASYGVLRAQEFAEDAETCFRATGSCCFEVEAIERRLKELEPPWSVDRNGALQLWLEPLAGRDYVVAVDSAGGGPDGDFAAVQVIDRATGMQCAELQQKIRPAELARVAVGLAKRYNGALLAIERNNHGGTVIENVRLTERYERMYRQNGEVGWVTTGSSKPTLVVQLETMLRQQPEMVKSRRLLAECRTFVEKGEGKTGAAAGSHDDLVIAMGLALAVRGEARQ